MDSLAIKAAKKVLLPLLLVLPIPLDEPIDHVLHTTVSIVVEFV